MNVGADEFLTHRADFTRPTSAARKLACRNDLTGITMRQQISAAWGKNYSAPTAGHSAGIGQHVSNAATTMGLACRHLFNSLLCDWICTRL